MAYDIQTASSLSFSLDLVRGVHARASVERRSCETRDARREKRGRQPLPSRTFSHARGHLRVSGVLLDGPRKKRDCSQSIRYINLNADESKQRIIYGRTEIWNLSSTVKSISQEFTVFSRFEHKKINSISCSISKRPCTVLFIT